MDEIQKFPVVRLFYLYRDAGNNKLFGEATFSNSRRLSKKEILRTISSFLWEGEYFLPSQWGLKALHFDSYEFALDHPLHELIAIELASSEFRPV